MNLERKPILSGEKPTPRSGLRAQLLLALGGLLLLLFVPFVFLVINLVRLSVPRATTIASTNAIIAYGSLFGFALLTFAYLVLTQILVRPLDAIRVAAERIAHGNRDEQIPTGGPREVAELGHSLQTMTEALALDEANLRAKINELVQMTLKLEQAQAQLVRSERLASVGRLSAGLAHEIGNPLAALMGMQDLLIEGGLDHGTQHDFHVRMRRETERIHTILRKLLDFARPEQRTSRLSMERAHVRKAVDEVFGLVRVHTSFRHVTLETDIDERTSACIANGELVQVLLNLIMNAADACGNEPGSCIFVTSNDTNSGTIEVCVSDNGPGVPPTVRTKIFEPFVTTKEHGHGTGLGLAVCRGLIEGVGGSIAYDDTFEDGARFLITLPT